jgi:hypothetical protein
MRYQHLLLPALVALSVDAYPKTCRKVAKPTTVAPAPASTISLASSEPAPVASSRPQRPKVGLGLNTDSQAVITSFGGGIGWYYSWNDVPLANTTGLEFVPMIWGPDAARAFEGKVPAGTKYMLSFNERE